MALVDSTKGEMIRALISSYQKDLADRESKMQQAIEAGADHWDEPDMRESRTFKLLMQLDRLNCSDTEIGGGREGEFSVQWKGASGKTWMWGCLFLHDDGRNPGIHT